MPVTYCRNKNYNLGSYFLVNTFYCSRHILLLHLSTHQINYENRDLPYDYHVRVFFESAITIVRLNKAHTS